MSEPFLGQVEVFAFNFAPRGWAFAAGQTMSISQSAALFSLLGTTYGGNGVTTFLLPDLRGRAANAFGQGPSLSPYVQGQSQGQEFHTLLTSEVPPHTHSVAGAKVPAPGGTNVPATNTFLASAFVKETGSPTSDVYSTATPSVTLDPSSVGIAGGSQPHENRMPFLTLNYCIALQGIFPSRN
jgi:microcystin-dependent protein